MNTSQVLSGPFLTLNKNRLKNSEELNVMFCDSLN